MQPLISAGPSSFDNRITATLAMTNNQFSITPGHSPSLPFPPFFMAHFRIAFNKLPSPSPSFCEPAENSPSPGGEGRGEVEPFN